MYILEEYLKRIGYEEPLVRYAEKTVVFIDNLPYKILEINRVVSRNSIGKFIISKRNFFVNLEQVEVDWEFYEDYIIKNFQGLKNAITDANDIFFITWEFFLSSNQNYFLSNFGHNSIYKTIDKSLPKHERIKSIEFIINILKLECNYIYNSWLETKKSSDNYSYWLAEIINS